MGCSCGRPAKVNVSKRFPKLYEPKKGTSIWYETCREGDLMKLLILLPHLTFDQLNRKEPNGSTSLHIACYKNHQNVAVALLVCGCDRTSKNKLGLTPIEETTSDTLRAILQQSDTILTPVKELILTELEEDLSAPNNKFIMGHTSLEDADEAKKMTEAYRMTGLKKMYMIAEVTSFSYIELRRIVNQSIPSSHPLREEAIGYLEKQDALGLIKLYTLQTDFYTALQTNNGAFTANIFVNLAKFRNRAFTGRTYRGGRIAHFDVIGWKWATKKPGRLIETQTFMSTSEVQGVAKGFSDNQPNTAFKVCVMFILDFPQACDTAIKLTEDRSKNIIGDLTSYPHEKEVLVTSYTLFKVNSVDYDGNPPWYRIHLTHVPIVT